MQRPIRLSYITYHSEYVRPERIYLRRRFIAAYYLVPIVWAFPFVSVKCYEFLDRLPYWDKRVEKRRREKMAFDWMLKSLSEKEQDIIEELSDF
eukprot:403347344